MQVRIAYGPGGIDVEIPDSHRIDVLEKHPVPPIGDPDARLRALLEAPSDCAPLRELARGRRDAVVVISDLTRPVPNATLLPPILDALRAGGLSPEAVTILVATGLHRPNTPEELDRMLGSELARSLRIEQHDARNAEAHRDLGPTAGGLPISLDRRFLDADLKITTGLIEPHLMAGYSGGRKAVCPGLAAVETVRVAHGPAMLEGRIGPGIVDGNPLHDALLEVQRAVGVDFLVNVALDRNRDIAGIFCGHPETAHAEGMAFVESESLVSLDAPADLVVTSGGGAPLDSTLYQSIKGISTASSIVRPGGTILLCASLSEGVGSASFEKLIRACANPSDFEARIEDPEFFAIDQWMIQHLCQARRRARVLLYTDAFPLAAVAEWLVEPARSPAEGVASALAELGPEARVAVLPQGPYVLASVRGALRPLGGPATG
jgi:nickel-dependent lactate racemase